MGQVRLASVRRSLFTGEAERSAFLARLVTGTRDVLRSNQGLAEHANYHEFCRLLGRLKTNYQLSELARRPTPASHFIIRTFISRILNSSCLLSRLKTNHQLSELARSHPSVPVHTPDTMHLIVPCNSCRQGCLGRLSTNHPSWCRLSRRPLALPSSKPSVMHSDVPCLCQIA